MPNIIIQDANLDCEPHLRFSLLFTVNQIKKKKMKKAAHSNVECGEKDIPSATRNEKTEYKREEQKFKITVLQY